MSNFTRRRGPRAGLLVRSLSGAVLVAAFLAGPLRGEAKPVEIAAGTPLWIQLPRHNSMKAGETLTGSLLYPVYRENKAVLPAGTVFSGKIIALEPDRHRRLHARLRGDFTPFYTPVVQFDRLVLPDGTRQALLSNPARDGFPVLHISPPPGQKKAGFLARQLSTVTQQAKDSLALFTTPGRGDRLVQFVYTQLPYHPQRIEAATTWTVELAQPLALPSIDVNNFGAPPAQAKETEWQLRAYLERTLSSASEKPGNLFRATVAEPIFNADHELVVPQGSVLSGEVTQAKPARSFGRKGKLRFKFRELKFPNGFSQPVESTVSGIDANKDADLQLDAEGGVQQKAQNRVIVPLVLTLLAGRAFDDDGSMAFHSAVASNGFGIVGRVVGIVAGSRNLAAGIGAYGAALSFYDLWLAHGKDVIFQRNTRIEITTAPSRKELPTPDAR